MKKPNSQMKNCYPAVSLPTHNYPKQMAKSVKKWLVDNDVSV